MLLYGRNVTSNLPCRQVSRDLDQLISEFIFALTGIHSSASSLLRISYPTTNEKDKKETKLKLKRIMIDVLLFNYVQIGLTSKRQHCHYCR